MVQDKDRTTLPVPTKEEWEHAQEFVDGVVDGSIRPKVKELEENLDTQITQIWKKE